MDKVSACSVDGCERKHLARGFCSLHYDRWKRHGDPTIVLRTVAATACKVEGCNGGAPIVQGHCPAHYRKLRLYGDPTVDRRVVASDECPKCGLPRRRRRTHPFHLECRPCINAEQRRRWTENEDYRLARAEAARRYYQENKESFAESNRRYHLENRDAVRAASRRWSEANRERLNAQARERYRLNPDAARASRHRYEAAKRDVVCEHGLSCVTESFLSELRWQPCAYCGDYANTADHVVPLSRGGLHCVENLVPACRRCNTSKNASTPDEWAERLRREAESDR